MQLEHRLVRRATPTTARFRAAAMPAPESRAPEPVRPRDDEPVRMTALP